MPDYPNFGLLDTSTVTSAQNVVSSRASNGAYHARVLGVEKRTWKLQHMLTRDELTLLRAFAADNAQQSVDFRWPWRIGSACSGYIVPGSIKETKWVGASRLAEVELTVEEA